MRKALISKSQPVPQISREPSHTGGPAARPFVFINMAMTADGKIATANRTVSTFGSKRDLDHLYELRATSDAVMNGARTVELNKVKMSAGGKHYSELRLRNGLSELPLRIIVSGSGSLDSGAPIFKHRSSPIIILVTRRISKSNLERLRDVADHVLICGETAIDWNAALSQIRRKWNVRRLLCEGGAAVNDALFQSDVVDEVHLTICPKIVGGRNSPTIADGVGQQHLMNAIRFRLASVNQVRDELFLCCRRDRTRAPLS